MKMRRIFYKNPANCSKILGILNNNFKPTLVQKFSKIKMYNALALPILLFGGEIWILRKKDKKTTDINREKKSIQKNCRVHPFWPQKESRNFVRDERRTN
jgi:hypothetical protein